METTKQGKKMTVKLYYTIFILYRNIFGRMISMDNALNSSIDLS